jgi:hypothetical protein
VIGDELIAVGSDPNARITRLVLHATSSTPWRRGIENVVADDDGVYEECLWADSTLVRAEGTTKGRPSVAMRLSHRIDNVNAR